VSDQIGGEELPVLIANSGSLQGQRWPLQGDALLIGRGLDADICIPDRQVSRHHARLLRSVDGYMLEDLGSKNGTHLNGTSISEPTLLQDGDVIQVAVALELVYVDTEATVPLAMDDAARMGLGRLRMDPLAHRVLVGEAEIDPPLSPPQYRLLAMLADNPGHVVTRDDVAETVWPGTKGVGVSNQAIDALVRRLRDRLAEVDPEHDYIVTVRGHGFRFDNTI
jgi:hypothetical protein